MSYDDTYDINRDDEEMEAGAHAVALVTTDAGNRGLAIAGGDAGVFGGEIVCVGDGPCTGVHAAADEAHNDALAYLGGDAA